MNDMTSKQVELLKIENVDILIDLAAQKLHLPKLNKTYSVSTGLNGIGEAENSGKTPRGFHYVAEKFGDDQPINSVFIARQPTGEIYKAALVEQYPERDWILSRILRLGGLEHGFNQGEGCDTYQRYIYIHGTPDCEVMGQPLSHGCIRMRNEDVIELFDLVATNALVYISEHGI